MDTDQVLRIRPDVFHRKYLFQSGNHREWMSVWLGTFNDFVLRGTKRYCVLWAVIFNLFFYAVAADGSGREYFIGNCIQSISSLLKNSQFLKK